MSIRTKQTTWNSSNVLIKYGGCVSNLHFLYSPLPRAIPIAVILVTVDDKLDAGTYPDCKAIFLSRHALLIPPRIPSLKASPHTNTIRRGGEVAVALKGTKVGQAVLTNSTLPRRCLLCILTAPVPPKAEQVRRRPQILFRRRTVEKRYSYREDL